MANELCPDCDRSFEREYKCITKGEYCNNCLQQLSRRYNRKYIIIRFDTMHDLCTACKTQATKQD
jgi:hypothetical protein